MAQNTCRKCNADVRMAPSAFNPGRSRILDAAPNAEGNTYIITGGQGKGRAMVLSGPILPIAQKAAREGELDLYIDHHATCPYAEDFR
jgi:hypothetical protein